MDAPTFTLSNDLLAEIQEAFALCDPENTGMIRRDDLGTVMRALGFNYTEAELYRYIEELDEEYTGNIEFKAFEELMTKTFELIDQNEYLLAAFKVFDSDNVGFISYGQLRTMFTNVGEKVSAEEYDAVFQEVDTDRDGVINLKDFLQAYRH